jgi:hypothetical protein
LLIAVCGIGANRTLTGPTGFSTAINQSGTPTGGIFYKVSAGTETSLTCSSSGGNTFMGISIYEYSGMLTTSVLNGTPGSNTGTSTTPSTGSTTTTHSDCLLVANLVTNVDSSYASWTNSFGEVGDYANNAGNPGSRHTYGVATRAVTATGTYSTGATTASGAWLGQIAAFRAAVGSLSVDIVDSGGTTVANPGVTMNNAVVSSTCQAVTGTLGIANEKIRLNNTTATATWTVSIAATGGATANWANGGATYDYNDGAGATAGCADGADADAIAGQLTVNPSVGTITPQGGCNNTGVSLGSSSAFQQTGTVVSSITLYSASGSAGTNCYWDLTGVALSQRIPHTVTTTGSYVINMTITVVP